MRTALLRREWEYLLDRLAPLGQSAICCTRRSNPLLKVIHQKQRKSRAGCKRYEVR
jgi:hypothetical protein